MPGKIVLVNPPCERVSSGYGYLNQVANRSPSLGLLHLAAQARAEGYDVSLIESDAQHLDAVAVSERILEARADFVGITLFTVGVTGASTIAREIRRHRPETQVIIGGPHVSSMALETVQRFPELGVAVCGEGEAVLGPLLRVLEHGKGLNSIPGLVYRDEEGVVQATTAAPVQRDLDALPMPAWDLLPGFPKNFPPAIYDYPRGPVATVAASRGCPFHCRFCDTSTFGSTIRRYSPRRVFEILSHLRERWGIRHVGFVDDLFVASRRRVSELCDLLIEAKLGLTWSCNARVDSVRPELLKKMRAAGCWEISYGLETGSPELLAAMGKVATVEQAEHAVRWTHAAGIRSKGLLMLGYPGESLATVEATRRFVCRIPMQVMSLSKFTPYPGSPIYIDLFGTRIRADHWDRMNGMNFVSSTREMNVEQLNQTYHGLLRSFYRRPRIARHYLWMSLRYPGHVLRLLRFGLAYLRSRLAGQRPEPIPSKSATQEL